MALPDEFRNRADARGSGDWKRPASRRCPCRSGIGDEPTTEQHVARLTRFVCGGERPLLFGSSGPLHLFSSPLPVRRMSAVHGNLAALAAGHRGFSDLGIPADRDASLHLRLAPVESLAALLGDVPPPSCARAEGRPRTAFALQAKVTCSDRAVVHKSGYCAIKRRQLQ